MFLLEYDGSPRRFGLCQNKEGKVLYSNMMGSTDKLGATQLMPFTAAPRPGFPHVRAIYIKQF